MPPPWLEAAVSALLPPAVREQVLGDLYERYRSPAQYLGDAARVVPMIVLGRIRRTADAQLSLIFAALIYLCYLSAAWFTPDSSTGMARLAIPAAATLLGTLLADAYLLRPHPVLGPPSAPFWALVLEGAPAGLPKQVLLPAACVALALVSLTRRLLLPEPRPWRTAGGGAPRAHQPEFIKGASVRFALALAILLFAAILRKWGL